ncbi:MAG: DNA gyrase subunit A [Acidimicrobiia bacterium]|nr:DNA gyrase subunit A [Acidimicrobiia bacterium]MYD03490.1 DNA gyrase subunit A [Acidimicrobiia bacterium]MYH54616.1 DNA gyrase subunit A [Acidimicrobiia bacterium]
MAELTTRSFPTEIIDINDEMSKSFVEYAMSVIVSRALPDVRDGLKPVQRRIIYAMDDMGVGPRSSHRKSATVVGEVIGKYHPHSNDAIYDALVRMGQGFSLRYPLIHPQGNFGSTDDPPAAMRYTECRLDQLSSVLLDGIDEDTVDFVDNFDGSEQEPSVLPSRFPNLLVNGSQGIAVGMATNIPPHNLNEIIDACLFGLENPDAGPEEYLSIVKGPDFPTGGYVIGKQEIKQALVSGRGSIRMRAVTDVEQIRKNRTAIVVTELPYQVSQDRVMARIADLVQKKVLDGIADLRNESSSKVGVRLIIELKRGATPKIVLNNLFKHTKLEDTFGVNAVALVDGVPRTLNIGEMIQYFLDHQMEVIERRTRFRLNRAQARSHILEGLIVAVDNIDAVIAIIRGSQDAEAARNALIEAFSLSEIQARAILDMPLRRLTSLETNRLREEHQELQKLIAELKSILADPALRRRIIADELKVTREKHGDNRRTQITPAENELSLEDLIDDDELIITVSAKGYVKSVAADTYRAQGRGGRGVKAAALRGDDFLTQVLHTTAHAFLLFFTNRGWVYRIRAHEIPRQARTARGVLAHSVLPLEPNEKIEAIVDTRDYESFRYMVMVTRKGKIKRTAFSAYNSRVSRLVAIRLIEDDEVVTVHSTDGKSDLLLFTRQGMGIRFSEEDVRAQGRATRGVIGVKLRPGDEVVGAAATLEGEDILLLTSGGYGKRTRTALFRRQGRAGLGLKAMKLTKVRGELIGARAVKDGGEVMVVSTDGIAIRTPTDRITRQSRMASGVKIMNLPEGERVGSFAPVPTNGSESK